MQTATLRCTLIALVAIGLSAAAAAQTPAPFPKPGDPPPTATQPPAATQTGQPPDPNAPTEATLGLPIYPTAEFLVWYDAGRNQRYYLFGTNVPFSDIVNYYRTVLRTRGDLVYDEPPIHMFEVGRFNENTMAFPPGVTVKDYTWGGSAGYLNPKPGAEPQRFATIIQIVPAPAPGR